LNDDLYAFMQYEPNGLRGQIHKALQGKFASVTHYISYHMNAHGYSLNTYIYIFPHNLCKMLLT